MSSTVKALAIAKANLEIIRNTKGGYDEGDVRHALALIDAELAVAVDAGVTSDWGSGYKAGYDDREASAKAGAELARAAGAGEPDMRIVTTEQLGAGYRELIDARTGESVRRAYRVIRQLSEEKWLVEEPTRPQPPEPACGYCGGRGGCIACGQRATDQPPEPAATHERCEGVPVRIGEGIADMLERPAAHAGQAEVDQTEALLAIERGERVRAGQAGRCPQCKAPAHLPNGYCLAIEGDNEPPEREALRRLVAARKAHLDAVAAYNARVKLSNSERDRGNWSVDCTLEYKAMEDTGREFARVAQDVADAALAAAEALVRRGA